VANTRLASRHLTHEQPILDNGNIKTVTNMNYQEIFYPESRFGGFTDIDGTMVFYSRVNALIEPSFHVLDLGCGRGAHVEDPIPSGVICAI